MWTLKRNPQPRIVVVFYGQDLANEFGRDIRNHITSNQGQDGTLDLGLRIAKDNGSVSSWKLATARGGVRSVGIGGGITGRPADVVFIDDAQVLLGRSSLEVYATTCGRQRASGRDSWIARIDLVLTSD